jgi:asparagine synthase (glutamine-hydrolysing)
MSGVFGYLDPRRRLTGTRLLDQMASVMSHRPWYETTYFNDDQKGVGIGRIGIGIFNKNKEAVWNEDRTKVILFTGEIYNLLSLNPRVSQLENALLELYEEEGEQFVKRMHGSFIFALWDKIKNQLIVANDRFGTYPLFYSFSNGRLVFAPELKAVLQDREIPKSLDLVGVAQYMRFQQFLGNRTYFESVKYLPGASILIFKVDSGSLEMTKYWNYESIPNNPNISFPESLEETGRMLREVMARLSGGKHRPGVFLSGGLDSRIIIGLIERRPIVSMTFGHKDSRDVRYAEMIAKSVGSEHYWHDLPNGKWVEENVDFHWDLTEGMHNWIHLHSITMLPEARQQFDVNLTGMGGGTLIKSPKVVDPEKYAEVDDYSLVSLMFSVMSIHHTWPGLTEAEERLLYTPSYMEKMQGLAFDSLYEELKPYLQYPPGVRGELFFVSQHNMRLINNMAVFGRSHIEFRYPYMDYELFDFIYSMPIQFRNNMRFARSLISKELPNMSKIPYDADEFLPTVNSQSRNLHALMIKAKRRFNSIVFPLFPDWKTLYADYEEYLRKDLKNWAEGILFDQRTFERGIFEPAALKSLMARHCSGKELWTIGKIAPLISFEMSLRNLVDNDNPG